MSRARRAARWALLCVLAALHLGRADPAWAQQREPELKAQVLFQLLLFVQWPRPAAAGAPLHFCVLEDTPLAQAMHAFEGRRLNDRVFAWRRVTAEQLATCHAAYVGRSGMPAPDRQAEARGVLWIGDELGLIDRGAMLNLQVEGGKVVFDIGLEALRRGGLDISAKVMRLARYVKDA